MENNANVKSFPSLIRVRMRGYEQKRDGMDVKSDRMNGNRARERVKENEVKWTKEKTIITAQCKEANNDKWAVKKMPHFFDLANAESNLKITHFRLSLPLQLHCRFIPPSPPVYIPCTKVTKLKTTCFCCTRTVRRVSFHIHHDGDVFVVAPAYVPV